MNLRIVGERATSSKSPKRYSLNRKIKWKERKQFADFIEVEKTPSSPFFSGSCKTAENGRCGKELASCEMRKIDCRETENLHVSSAFGVPVGQDHRICLSSPVTEAMTPGLAYTPSGIASQHFGPVSLQPGINVSPMMPCSTADFRVISRPVKRKPQNQFQGQATEPSFNPSHTLHYGNFHYMQDLQTLNILHNGTGGMIATHSSMQWNNLQESPFVPTYMTPIQSSGFQFNPISRQGNGEAYNAFTAYGNPFGVFWSRQN